MPENETSDRPETVVCPVTPWFLRRVGMVAAVFGGLALYFWYDGAIGYPRDNYHAALFEAFEAGKTGKPVSEPVVGLSAEQMTELGIAKRTGAEGGSWAAFAAERHLGEAKPDRHSAEAIRQQFHFAWILGLLAVATAGYGFFQRNRSLRAGPDWFETPGGERIPFSTIRGADFSKWDRGIARLETGEEGEPVRRIRIDDYKYRGSGRILELIRRFGLPFDTDDWPNFEEENRDDSTGF